MKISEMLGQGEGTNHARRLLYSALWQADGKKIRRFVPIDFIGRYMDGFFDYAIADEVHELKGGDTAQGNALGHAGRVRPSHCGTHGDTFGRLRGRTF